MNWVTTADDLTSLSFFFLNSRNNNSVLVFWKLNKTLMVRTRLPIKVGHLYYSSDWSFDWIKWYLLRLTCCLLIQIFFPVRYPRGGSQILDLQIGTNQCLRKWRWGRNGFYFPYGKMWKISGTYWRLSRRFPKAWCPEEWKQFKLHEIKTAVHLPEIPLEGFISHFSCFPYWPGGAWLALDCWGGGW